MKANSIEVIDRGLRCLSEHLGAQETEIFISTLLREKFDYTDWRKHVLDRIKTFDDLDDLLQSTRNQSRFHGNAEIVL